MDEEKEIGLVLGSSCKVSVHPFSSPAGSTSLTLWVGTNGGRIYVHVLSVPKDETKRKENPCVCQLGEHQDFG